MQRKSMGRWAVAALFAGAIGIGFAPIFVRLSEVGPSATAFYRVLIALPFLFLATHFEPRPLPGNASRDQRDRRGPLNTLTPKLNKRLSKTLWPCALAGLFFAGDLAFWHWSIKLTSVANATLLTNCAPFFVMLGARALFGERITPLLIFGLVVTAAGSSMLVGASFQVAQQHLLGDLLAFITAGFYGGYLLTVKYLRRDYSTARILAWSGMVSCLALVLIAALSGETMWTNSWRGWLVLFGLGIISHLGGQGLIGWALAHLPAGFSSVGLLLQPVVAAMLAWLLLSEPLSALQTAGGLVILLGIAIAGRSSAAPRENNPAQIRRTAATIHTDTAD